MTEGTRAAIAATRWYHVLDLGDGVVTPGEYDLRAVAGRVPLPARLDGLRCLDVGTRDGFWAFEMERRGAAEVLAIDVGDTRRHDWPAPGPRLGGAQLEALAAAGSAWAVAADALGSGAQWRDTSVYELDPDDVGEFDVAFVGTLLLHLRDPVGALTAVRRVMRPGGLLVLNEPVSLGLTLLRRNAPTAVLMTLDEPFWWIPNRLALKRYVEAAGFTCTHLSRPYPLDLGPTAPAVPLRGEPTWPATSAASSAAGDSPRGRRRASRMTDLAARAAELSWYHTMDLAPGVTTDGFFDTRPTVAKVPLPARLDGLRCLDVGTWDGFWAFEMERRGAASVTAIDIEDPARWDWPGHTLIGPASEDRLLYLEQFKSGAAAFKLAREALGSRVERVDRSVYDLDPAVDGTYDFVFLGSLLLHLRDPVLALERLRAVCSGQAVLTENVQLIPTLLKPRTPVARLEGMGRPWWWQANAAGFRRMVRAAGWVVEEQTGVWFLPTGTAHPKPPLRNLPRAMRTPALREAAVIRLAGLPHVAVRARPAG